MVCKNDREFFEGEWHKGKKNGVGTFTYMSGDKYAPETGKTTSRTAKAFSLTQNGGKVNGEWKAGRMVSGEGTYVQPDGSRHRGVWREGKLVTTTPLEK